MRIKFEFLRVSVFAVAIASAIVGCNSEDPIGTPLSSISQNSPPVNLQEFQRADGGRTFTRDDGWPIPSFHGAPREEFETSLLSATGRSVKVYRTVVGTRSSPSLPYIANPLHLVGGSSKVVLIHRVTEYRSSAGIFCYQFLVNDPGFDENANTVYPIRSVLYPYSYYDEDGDGIFESLVLNEKDRNGRLGFGREPHVPEWATSQAK